MMKIKKHKVVLYREGLPIDQYYYKKQEAALRKVKLHKSGIFEARYKGIIEIDLYCENCDKDLKSGDKYLKVDEHTRYCPDCYEEETFTSYIVGGEQVADENDAEFYDESDTEGEVE